VAASAAGVVALDETLDDVEAPAGPLVYLGTVLPPLARDHAAVVLPITNMAEEDGTFRNLQGRVQAYYQAKPPAGMSRPAAWVLAGLRQALGAGAAV
jgi:NADH-quinone oxidoreductase subunit G